MNKSHIPSSSPDGFQILICESNDDHVIGFQIVDLEWWKFNMNLIEKILISKDINKYKEHKLNPSMVKDDFDRFNIWLRRLSLSENNKTLNSISHILSESKLTNGKTTNYIGYVNIEKKINQFVKQYQCLITV